MTAPLAAVKEAAAQAVASNPDGSLYQLTLDAFWRTYHEMYEPRTDRKEFERIKRHVRRILAGDTGPGRGGAREGAGRPAKEQGE